MASLGARKNSTDQQCSQIDVIVCYRRIFFHVSCVLAILVSIIFVLVFLFRFLFILLSLCIFFVFF